MWWVTFLLQLSESFFLDFFGHSPRMHKFPGQGLNLHRSSHLSHSSNNTGSLPHWAIREFLSLTFDSINLFCVLQLLKPAYLFPFTDLESFQFFFLSFLSSFLPKVFRFSFFPFFPFLPSFLSCLFAFSRAAPMAYGISQAKGLIGAVAAGLRQSHSNMGSEPRLQQHQILNPLSKARDRTLNLMIPSQIR